MKIIGIDPGQAGGIVVLTDTGNMEVHKMPETPADMYELLEKNRDDSVCYLEKVHSMPGQGVSSSFKFGRGYGNIEMALLALKIPTHNISPEKWMKELALGTRGERSKTDWKNHLKKTAQQLFPSIKFTLATCDASLIAEYGRRMQIK